MNERRLWAAAARVIMEDAARIIRAARKQEAAEARALRPYPGAVVVGVKLLGVEE